MAPPGGWPAHIAHLDSPRLSSLLSPLQRDSVLVPAASVGSECSPLAGRPRRTRIRAIDDASHPACGQSGLFAAEHLEPGAFILPYFGLVHGRDDVDPASDYDLSLDRELGVGIDAAKMGNEARFVNDYRGIPLRRDRGPNAEFRDCWVSAPRGARARVVGVYVLPAGKSGKRGGGIAKGEEIVVSYGKGFWAGRVEE